MSRAEGGLREASPHNDHFSSLTEIPSATEPNRGIEKEKEKERKRERGRETEREISREGGSLRERQLKREGDRGSEGGIDR